MTEKWGKAIDLRVAVDNAEERVREAERAVLSHIRHLHAPLVSVTLAYALFDADAALAKACEALNQFKEGED